MKKLLILGVMVFLLNNFIKADDIPVKSFSKEEIKNLSGAYLENKLGFENPVLVDVDKDGDFDALNFNSGNVEYYKNTGTLESPSFVLENKHYDKYTDAFFVPSKMPYPMFFADKDADGDMDMFVVKDKEFNKTSYKYDYKIAYAENALDLDTGTLITIILVLVIVLLIIAIVR